MIRIELCCCWDEMKKHDYINWFDFYHSTRGKLVGSVARAHTVSNVLMCAICWRSFCHFYKTTYITLWFGEACAFIWKRIFRRKKRRAREKRTRIRVFIAALSLCIFFFGAECVIFARMYQMRLPPKNSDFNIQNAISSGYGYIMAVYTSVLYHECLYTPPWWWCAIASLPDELKSKQ